MESPTHPSDLTDEQWGTIEKVLPPAKPGGRPRTTNLREVINGILYLLRTGCSWRTLPPNFPSWPTVHDYYRNFRKDGTLEKIYRLLYERPHIEYREASDNATVKEQPLEKSGIGQEYSLNI
ncbi:MAG: transposase [Planctomycetes bacterium]|nr:transposase [Planctomycetota bacterium]